MNQIVQDHLVKKFLSQNFGKRQFVHSKTIRSADDNVEVYGYKGAVVLVKELGDTVLYRIPNFESK